MTIGLGKDYKTYLLDYDHIKINCKLISVYFSKKKTWLESNSGNRTWHTIKKDKKKLDVNGNDTDVGVEVIN